MNLCQCGCGAAIPEISKLRRPQRYVWGHNGRLQERSSCLIVTCRAFAHSAGYCGRHLMRIKKYGTIHPVTAMLNPERYFWSFVTVPESDGDCWLWTGPVNSAGYGELETGKKLGPAQTRVAHRVAYELYNGPIPDLSLHVDHLCRVPRCVNPSHLEAVTVAENTRRGLHGVLRTHCREGHELAGNNLYLRVSDNSRYCRRCRYAQHVARRRSGVVTAAAAARTHCSHGHELTPENTKHDGPRRLCRECARKSAREYARRQRAAIRTELNLAQMGVD